jgi:hypothetical protein
MAIYIYNYQIPGASYLKNMILSWLLSGFQAMLRALPISLQNVSLYPSSFLLPLLAPTRIDAW